MTQEIEGDVGLGCVTLIVLWLIGGLLVSPIVSRLDEIIKLLTK